MALFGGSKKNSSATNNTASDAKQENNSGNIANGNVGGSIVTSTTDMGAINAAFGSNTAITQANLAANLNAVKEALGFGNAALDANSYVSSMAFDSGNKALDIVGKNSNSVIDKVNELATTVLVNGERATRGALELAGDVTKSEGATITGLMIKSVVVLGGVLLIGMVLVKGKK